MFMLDPRRDCTSNDNSGLHRRSFARRQRQIQRRRASSLELCRRHRRGGSKFLTLLVLAGMGAGGVYAYRRFFRRSGEAAVQLIPADAQMLVTLDMTPSVSQAPTFKRIADAFKAEHLDTRMDDLLSRNMSHSPLARDLRPLATGSAAFALLKTQGAAAHGSSWDGDSAIFVAIKDAGQTSDVLARDAQKSNVNGLDYYKVTGDTHCMAVIGSYLVTADKLEDLTRIEAVRKGESPAISTLPDYQAARAGLAPDSNMMVFVSGDAISEGMRQGIAAAGHSNLAAHNPVPRAHYIAFGMAIRDGGIDAVAEVPLDAPVGAAGNELSHVAPLDPNIWRKLPSGAYGLFAIAQPGKYYNYFTSLANTDADARRQMNEGVASFERETGISVTRDILTGLNGNAVMAVYPDADNPRASVDGLIVLDDTSGADPAALSDRVRGYVERASGQNGGHPLHFTSENRNGVIVWTLDQAAQREMQQSLAGGVSDAQRSAGMTPTPSPVPDTPPAADMPVTPPTGGTPDSGGARGGDAIGGSGGNASGNGAVGGNGGNATGGNGNNGANRDPADAHTNLHIHGDSGGHMFDDSFALHHGDTDIHVDDHGVQVHSGGNHLSANENGLDVHVENNANGGSATPATSNGGATSSELLRAAMQQNGQNVTGTVGDAPSGANADVRRAVGNKTITWAQVGHAVILATSPHMLDRAIAAYTNGSGSLANDAAFAAMRQRVPAGAQNVMLLDVPSILNALRPLIARAMRDNQMGLTAQDITGLAGAPGNGLVTAQQYDGKTWKSTYFLPLDYERVLHMAGALQRADGR